ncbi:ABC transporter substrate-binding protein [Adlercreutzia caecimuris]|uniref:ABC transporter substrate-binding protein n=1 Tax=Adlercreutzia caecimuris TaxID=671266 RepID=UPI00249400DD|nr:ABC transporter substrate-binding protein [Adlercreutzia caecimuris]
MNELALSRRAFMIGAASLAAAALAGCSSEGTGTSPASDVTAPDAAAGSPDPEINERVASVLTAAVAYDDGSCNPIGCSSTLFVAAGWHVFEGLYELDLHTYRTELGLAAEIPLQVSDLEYEVTLREGAVFSDGSPLTVNDVCNAFTRNRESDFYAPLLSFIQSVEAKDASTVSFKLAFPMGTLLQERLALVRIFPAAQTDEELNTLPIGSGPWRYDTIDAADGGFIAFVPNPHYEGAFPATCERMEWAVATDDEARTQLLCDGQVVCAEAAPEVMADQITESGAVVDYVPGMNVPFLMFNCEKPPFDDARVRQALLYALDVDGMIGRVMAGHARPATSLLPDYFRGYHRAATVYSYDPERARALLAEAGAADLALTLRVNDNWVRLLAESVVGDWNAVGVTAEVVYLDQTSLFADISEPPKKKQVLPFDAVLCPGDPSRFGNDPDLIMNWWYGSNVWTLARSCWAYSKEFDTLADLLQEARAVSDENEQQRLWHQCYDLIAAEAPLYPLFHRETATAYFEGRLSGYDPISATGLLFLGTTPMKESDPI